MSRVLLMAGMLSVLCGITICGFEDEYEDIEKNQELTKVTIACMYWNDDNFTCVKFLYLRDNELERLNLGNVWQID